MYCKNCGAEVRPGERFCQNCGAELAVRQAAELAGVMRGFEELAASAPAAETPLSETPTLTEDFAVTRERFNLILGGTLLWGFLLNVLFCIFFKSAVARLPYGVVMIAYAVLAFTGILINTRSSKPVWSFVGYNLVVLPLGLILSVLITEVGSDAVREAFQIASAVTAGMLLLSNWKSELFLRMGPCLFAALLLTMIAELVQFFINRSFVPTNLIATAIFCLYIGYDWARAQQRPCTADNAIDSACALYLDIINLVMRILSARSRRRN